MEHVVELLLRVREGDQSAKDTLVKENLGLIHHVVKRFIGRGVETEDLFQIGSIGLIKAIDRFDLSYEVKFSTYAVPMIVGEIKRFLRDDNIVKVSRSLKELAMKAGRERERFTMEWGREPRVEELAERVGVTKEELVQAMESAIEVESLQKVIFQGEGDSICLEDKLENPRDEQEQFLHKLYVKELIDTLGEKERKLILLRFFQDKTQSQVAEVLGMSQVQVSRLEKKILIDLRTKI